MKLLLLFILAAGLSACSIRTKETNKLPSFNLLLIDSGTIFNTSQIPDGKPIVLMYFSPDCEHCLQETEMLLKHMTQLKNTLLYLISIDSIQKIKAYQDYYNISIYKNIIIGKDYKYEFLKQFKPLATKE